MARTPNPTPLLDANSADPEAMAVPELITD